MKVNHLIIAALVLALVCISSIVISAWNNHLIFMSNGEVIEARKIWVVFDEVFYEKGEGTLFTVKTAAVDKIIRTDFSSLDDWKIIISYEMASGKGIFGILKNKMARIMCFAALGIVSAIYLLRFLLSKKTRIRETDDLSDRTFTLPVSASASDTERIILFFLNFYLLEIGAKKTDRYHYRPTDIKGPSNTVVYEFCARIDGQWQTRRMSIGRIGEASGARSRCFYVIYDDHLVVKIPPHPVPDIHAYIESIAADRHIADRLAPRECLVPKVSILLKRVPAFVRAVGKPVAENEPACIDGLAKYPGYQKFLQIGGAFAFYMDLSRHFFLGQILKDCHDADREMYQEIHKYLELIWNPHEFAERYGDGSADLCFRMHDVYDEFDKRFSASAIAAYQKKLWFGDAFLGDENMTVTGKLPGTALPILHDLKNRHPEIIDEYNRLLRNYTREKFFKQNTVKIQSICSRLVELLSWLYFKHVAIRDLKPDNLLVAGDPEKYPFFLNTTGGFEIGLIDVEIAVYLGPEAKNPDNQKLPQPKLGWTPFYATPSHLFMNGVLARLFTDVRNIFFLQDWYAAVAMIFEAITGEKLFMNTAAILTGSARELPRYFDDPAQMTVFARSESEKFWRDAAVEFNQKLRENESILTSIHLEISNHAKRMFKAAAANYRQDISRIHLDDIKSGISAYDLLDCLFAHVREKMTVNS